MVAVDDTFNSPLLAAFKRSPIWSSMARGREASEQVIFEASEIVDQSGLSGVKVGISQVEPTDRDVRGFVTLSRVPQQPLSGSSTWQFKRYATLKGKVVTLREQLAKAGIGVSGTHYTTIY